MSNTAELEHGECCCCLEQGEHRDVSKQYYWDGQPEIYEVLFKDAFGIVLKYPENTKLICECCIVKLRQANNFRSMVETSQQSLSDRINWPIENINVGGSNLKQVVKIENIEIEVDEMAEADTRVVEIVPVEHVNIKVERTDTQENETEIRIELEPLGSQLEDVPADPSTSLPVKKFRVLEDLLVDGPAHKSKRHRTRRPIADGKSSFSCDVCEYKATSEAQLTAHSLTHPQLHFCTFCPYKSTTKQRVATHMRTHTGEKPFSCDDCDFKTATKGNLKVHFRIHSGEKPYTCEICSYRTSIKGNLKEHMCTHTGIKPFSCELCSFKTAIKGRLKIHNRTHTKEKLFSCDICPYKTGTTGHLKVHKRTHTGEKPFSCHICGYKGITGGHLKVHMRTHSGEKRFSCEFCEYKSLRKGDLTVHLRTHTGERPYSCDYCQYIAATKGHLNVHILEKNIFRVTKRKITSKIICGFLSVGLKGLEDCQEATCS